MNTYRITFLHNKIVSIRKSEKHQPFDGNYFYYAPEGTLIYALVKAETAADARTVCEEIISIVVSPRGTDQPLKGTLPMSDEAPVPDS